MARRYDPERRQRIIDAALRCLARDGYAAASLQRVADEAGLGKRAVAEKVEQEEQLARLVAAGCDAAQGYLLASPQAAGALLPEPDGRPLPAA